MRRRKQKKDVHGECMSGVIGVFGEVVAPALFALGSSFHYVTWCW